MFVTFDPKELPQPKVQGILTGGVAPRPIALASTMNKEGRKNLSPFSFFNAFGSNPPTIAFSPSRRGRNNTVKDTYNNLVATGEVVINAVTYSMVEQINLASCEYGPDVDEFKKAGFTPLDSDIVKPKRVKESPFQMECILKQMVHLGDGPGSGNLAICEVVKFHVAEHIITDGRIDTRKIDHVGRNGSEYYTRASGDSLFIVKKPGQVRGIGFDGLPDYMKESVIYTANNLGRFAMAEKIPTIEEAAAYMKKIVPVESGELTFSSYINMKDWEKAIAAALYLTKVSKKGPAFLEIAAKAVLEDGNMELAWIIAVYKGAFLND